MLAACGLSPWMQSVRGRSDTVAAVDRLHLALDRHAHGAPRGLVDVRDDRAGRAAPGEQAAGRVAALRERLERARVPDLVGRARELGSRHDDDRQRRVEIVDGAQHGVGDGGILAHVRRERAVQLDVVQVAAEHAEHAVERAHLVDDIAVGLLGRDLQRASPEPDEVGQAGVRADREPVLEREPRSREHRGGIAPVEAAGEVHGGRVRERPRVVAHAPGAVRFAGVDVDVDRGHGLSDRTRSRPVCRYAGKTLLSCGLKSGKSRSVRLLVVPPDQFGARVGSSAPERAASTARS